MQTMRKDRNSIAFCFRIKLFSLVNHVFNNRAVTAHFLFFNICEGFFPDGLQCCKTGCMVCGEIFTLV